MTLLTRGVVVFSVSVHQTLLVSHIVARKTKDMPDISLRIAATHQRTKNVRWIARGREQSYFILPAESVLNVLGFLVNHDCFGDSFSESADCFLLGSGGYLAGSRLGTLASADNDSVR